MRRIFKSRNNHLNHSLLAFAGLLLTTVAFAGNAFAAGDAARGKDKSATCAACHGADGNSINPEWPSLAGQHPKYLINSLYGFKNGQRENILMSAQADALDDQEIEDLAAFFATQVPHKRTADPELVDQGERLYRGGDIDKGISACTACHGPTGRGNPGAGYPLLAGQHATYTVNQLLAYRAGERQTDAENNQIMRNVAALMNDQDIRAVAAYIQGLQ